MRSRGNEFLLVVQAHQHAFALGKLIDRTDQGAPEARVAHLLERIGITSARWRSRNCHPRRRRPGCRNAPAGRRARQPATTGTRPATVPSLATSGSAGARQAMLQPADRLFDVALGAPDLRGIQSLAQFVQHGALDALVRRMSRTARPALPRSARPHPSRPKHAGLDRSSTCTEAGRRASKCAMRLTNGNELLGH